MWKQWINALLGLVIVAMAITGGVVTASATLGWTIGLIGAAVLVFSVWTIAEVPRAEYEQIAHRHSHA